MGALGSGISGPGVITPRVRTLRAGTVGAMGALMAVYLVSLTGPDRGYSVWEDGVLGNVVLGLPAAVCFARAVLDPARRVPFTLIGLAAAAFTAGNCVYVFHVQFLDPVPYPSPADIGYLAPYPLLLTAVGMLARPELRRMPRGLLLDGLLGALAVAAAGSILTVHAVVSDLAGPWTTRVVGAAYPVLDLTLAALIAGIVTLQGARPGASWLWLGSGVLTFALADSLYLFRGAPGTYAVGTPLDGLWAVGLTLMAVAAVVPYRPGGRRSEAGAQSQLLLPNLFSLVAVALLVYGAASQDRLPLYAVALAMITLGLAVKRIADGFASLRLIARIHHQERTDELTQLPNRRAFTEGAQQALLAMRPGEELAVAVLDVDGFKHLNETFGHHAGAELLRQLGPRLQRLLRPGDLLARIGGDEFGVLICGRDSDGQLAVADHLVRAAGYPFLIDGVVHQSGASVGLARSPYDGDDIGVLSQRADVAMFDARQTGAGVVRYDAVRHARRQEELNAHEAIDQHQLEVHYQPQFDVASGRMTGVEALVRWRHPDRGLLFPDSFLPHVEAAGLMPELTLEVLDVAARDRRAWSVDGAELEMSVNIAPSALLNDDLLDEVRRILDRRGMPPRALTLEITENVLLNDVDRSLRNLRGLRDLGIKLSLDDYGTGYCSLTYLRDLPITEVKIDRSFVMDLHQGSPDAAIVRSTVDLAHALGMRTVAEGVENDVALDILSDLGCDTVQGYLLGRPMPSDDVRRRLQMKTPDRA